MILNETETATNVTTTEYAPTSQPVLKQDLRFMLIPLTVIVLVVLLSALVYLMARKKRLELVRENLLHLYEFDSNENEWESPLLTSDENYGSCDYYNSTAL